MNAQALRATAAALVAGDKGLLAMDESNPTCGKRFAALGIPQTKEARRAWGELIVTTPNLADSISGAILFEETLHQNRQDGVDAVADATVTALLRAVPAAVPGIASLSGGQSAELASARLNTMNRRFKARLPWVSTFSFSRAIQQPALDIWRGEPGNVEQAQRALQHRAACNRAARRGNCNSAGDAPA